MNFLQQILYIDPGSGSYLVQILAAAALGIIYFFKNIRLYVTSFFYSLFRSRKKKDKTGQQQ